MLRKHEREKIRASLVEMARQGDSDRRPVAVPGGQKRLTPHQIWQLLNAVDNVEAENAHLRKTNLFSLLAEAHAATAPRKATPATVLRDK